MKITSVNIGGKLPQGLVELYADVSGHAKALDINYLVVGAMARDLVLVHGFGANIERGTRDVDFGINIANWDEFDALTERLLAADYNADKNRAHRLYYTGGSDHEWEIDIVPFGEIADADSNIYWPPKQQSVMNVRGFSEAFANALQVQISEDPKIVIPVASPVGICLLKLIAWLDRETDLRSKDASDFIYLVETYSKIPEVFDALYDEGYMEYQEWDETKACAMKLGNDVSEIAAPDTKTFLETELFSNHGKTELFIRDMKNNTNKSLEQCEELLSIFKDAFLSDDLL
ncbi:MAG: nucleotidyl transferase AbiEii/AbiGii toxin family protein [Piscirickettsiaceae bacterium]|nr:nucleotidyl transferase AbiEii/AbiGii toxin family protein [Piscirickettsiaceae bacterium]